MRSNFCNVICKTLLLKHQTITVQDQAGKFEKRIGDTEKDQKMSEFSGLMWQKDRNGRENCFGSVMSDWFWHPLDFNINVKGYMKEYCDGQNLLQYSFIKIVRVLHANIETNAFETSDQL